MTEKQIAIVIITMILSSFISYFTGRIHGFEEGAGKDFIKIREESIDEGIIRCSGRLESIDLNDEGRITSLRCNFPYNL